MYQERKVELNSLHQEWLEERDLVHQCQWQLLQLHEETLATKKLAVQQKLEPRLSRVHVLQVTVSKIELVVDNLLPELTTYRKGHWLQTITELRERQCISTKLVLMLQQLL